MYLVTDTHTPSYANPIVVGKGECFHLSGRSDDWDGHIWLWANAADNRQGWVPDNLPVRQKGHIYAAYDYNAKELAVEHGEHVEVQTECHGWGLCANKQGKTGWVPMRFLNRLVQ